MAEKNAGAKEPEGFPAAPTVLGVSAAPGPWGQLGTTPQQRDPIMSAVPVGCTAPKPTETYEAVD